MASEYNVKQKRMNMGLAIQMMRQVFHRKTKSGKPIATRYCPQYIKKLCKLSVKEAQDIGLFPRPQPIMLPALESLEEATAAKNS